MIDIKKKYKTRSGFDVRLVSDQGHPDFPIVGYIRNSLEPSSWNQDGKYHKMRLHDYDLVEVKEKKVMYLLIHAHGDLDTSTYPTDSDKDYYISRIRVEYEEGQFDD